ncbi:UNVERIFIED_CONTAM: hypothetical protein ABID98_003216 [Brevibacillus sp. OAP136]
MFDEFFYRRRKDKGMLYLMIGFIILAVALIGGGIMYVL